MEELLQQILQECRPYTGQGALASYIPELARQDPDRLGIAVFHKDGTLVEAGDSRRSFTIQSVMKPLSLLLALQDNGRETVRAHVGVEATGKPFDAINVADNALLAKHLNPMVNAGAILMCQLIGGETYDHRFQRFHPGRISKDDPGSPCQTGRGGRKTGSDPSHRRIHRR